MMKLETCKLYTQLESMRFGNKFSYAFYVDETHRPEIY